MESMTLKSCPFCGGEAEIIEIGSRAYMVKCKECGVKTPRVTREGTVVRIWNTRKPMKRIVDQLKELRMKEYDDTDEEPDLTDVEDIFEDGKSQGRYEAYGEVIRIAQKACMEPIN